jgi:NAD(P)-dependent dehydrogenase (short-subunit alcohol dehydrogenase family)
MKIDKNTFLVTGGISGLGAAVTELLLKKGANVVAVDVNEEKGKEFEKDHKNVLFVKADVTSEESVKKAIAAGIAKFGGMNGVVNCAGVALPARVLSKNGAPHNLSQFSKIVEINLIGSFNVLRLAAEAMAKQEAQEGGEKGVIINVASVAAFEGQIGQAAYSASKGGVVAMTLPIARELGALGIRVNVIAPGVFRSPMTDLMADKVRKSLEAQVPFPPRLGRADEFASLAAHIIENQYFNGTVVRLDGSIRMAAL